MKKRRRADTVMRNQSATDTDSLYPLTTVPPRRQTWGGMAREIYDKIFENEIFGRAAQLAYYWLFSLFPLMIFLTTLLAFSPMARDLKRWIDALNKILPREAFILVRDTFYEVITNQNHGLLSFSILLVLWASSSGMGAVITALNRAYNLPESRPWWKERLLAIVLTLGLTFFILVALTLIFFGDFISNRIARIFGYGSTFTAIWGLAQWPVVIFFVLVGIELIYYFAPNHKQHWKLLTPGGMFALVLWLLISFGFRFYVSYFANYNALYGALGGVMLLMIWLYLTSLAILVGGVINSVIGET